MNEYRKPLADAVKRARGRLGLTQEQVAELSETDSTTIMKMENLNRASNPELATLFRVVRVLNIDPQEIFYPGLKIDNPRIRVLQQIISDCTDAEADALIPIIRELIRFMRASGGMNIHE